MLQQQEVVVVPSHSQNFLSQACSSFSSKPGGSLLLVGVMTISLKSQLPEDKP